MLVTLLLIVGPIIGIAVGYALGRGNPDTRLDKSERQELESYRNMEMELTEKASEAATLGDDFGVRALGILSKNRIERSKK
jgi:hypothetical protein